MSVRSPDGETRVIALLSTPFSGTTRQDGRRRFAARKEGRRRFKASDLELRSSDVDFLADACHSCGLDAAQKQRVDAWAKTGAWKTEAQLTVGAVLLAKPRGLQHMGQISGRSAAALWHSWGSPLPHLDRPQWLIFEVVASVAFLQPLDHRAFALSVKQAEQRSSWTIRLPAKEREQLQETLCTNGDTCLDNMVQWGLENLELAEYTVFTSLAPVVFLMMRGKFNILADMARFTPKLRRNPRGVAVLLTLNFRSAYLLKPGLCEQKMQGLLRLFTVALISMV